MPRSLLVTTMLTLLAATGCGSATPEQLVPAGVGHARSHHHGDHRPRLPGDPFDTSRPAIHNLDPGLLHALESAARDARADGVGLLVTSGWRSRAHQQRLLDEAIAKYGSEEEASRYVSTPDSSAHVTGHAVDIGPAEADEWLARHGATYGLCQVFANEIWHYELATSPGGACPAMLPDSSYRR